MLQRIQSDETPDPDKLIITERDGSQICYNIERGIKKEIAVFHDVFGDFKYEREVGNKPKLIRWCYLSDIC